MDQLENRFVGRVGTVDWNTTSVYVLFGGECV